MDVIKVNKETLSKFEQKRLKLLSELDGLPEDQFTEKLLKQKIYEDYSKAKNTTPPKHGSTD